MTLFFYAHSGVRYLVLLAGLFALALFALGFAQKKEFGKLHRIAGASFTGLLHTQVLLGIVLVAMGRYYPALIGHIVMMSLATVASQLSQALNKRRPTPGFTLPLAGVVVALLCLVGGVMAIGRGVFQTTTFAP